MVIHASVWKEYAPLVREETKFWNAGELSIHAGLLKGINISADSPKTIISGGIEFATPPDFHAMATNGAVFVLNDEPEDKWKTWSPAIEIHPPSRANGTNGAPQINSR